MHNILHERNYRVELKYYVLEIFLTYSNMYRIQCIDVYRTLVSHFELISGYNSYTWSNDMSSI